MPDSRMEHVDIIFPEMMAHTALFTHICPKKIAIVGDQNQRILHEALKHKALTDIQSLCRETSAAVHDQRVQCHSLDDMFTLKNTFDIIINTEDATNVLLENCFRLLSKDGILVQQSESPFDLLLLKELAECLQNTGFMHLQLFSFPEPHFSLGWRAAFMAIKQGMFRRVREKAIFEKSFKTYYYNYDIHKAATALPEFMRDYTF